MGRAAGVVVLAAGLLALGQGFAPAGWLGPSPAQKSAFGIPLANPEVVDQHLSFAYNLNTELVSTTVTGGASTPTVVPPFATVLGGVGGTALIQSRHYTEYVPGQGLAFRFTSIHPTCASPIVTEVGAGDGTDGIGFGCCASCGSGGAASFAAWLRSNGTTTYYPTSQWTGFVPDHTRLNVYQVAIQWLGGGQLAWSVENPGSGEFELVYLNKFANTGTVTSFRNPSLPLRIYSSGNGTVKVPSISAIRQGLDNSYHPPWSVLATKSVNSGSTVPILTLKNSTTHAGIANRAPIEVDSVSVFVNGAQDTDIQGYKNSVVDGGSFGDVDATNSVAQTDTTGGQRFGGRAIFSFTVPGNEGQAKYEIPDLQLAPGDTLTVTGQSSSATPSIKVGLNWSEKL
jgi:hypothetical protein